MLRQGLQATVTRSDSSETRASPCGDWGVGGEGGVERCNRSMEEFNTNCQNQSKILSDMVRCYNDYREEGAHEVMVCGCGTWV